jgi:hypothetical protein
MISLFLMNRLRLCQIFTVFLPLVRTYATRWEPFCLLPPFLSFLVLPLTTAVVCSWVRLVQAPPFLRLMVEVGSVGASKRLVTFYVLLGEGG